MDSAIERIKCHQQSHLSDETEEVCGKFACQLQTQRFTI